jgi:Anti-sigma-K factor rskA, C-terminal
MSEDATEKRPAPDSKQAGRASWSRFVRPGLWRALGGMGIAFGLACAIVLIEVSAESARRVRRLDRRVGNLKSSVQKLEQKREQIERQQTAVDQLLSRLLVAPDLRTIRLAAANSRRASGNILMSSRNSAAVLSATGLEPSAEGKIYRLWWIERRGAAVKAAEFQVASAGHVSIAADPPPSGDTVEARVTLESQADAQKPSGELALSGKFSR